MFISHYLIQKESDKNKLMIPITLKKHYSSFVLPLPIKKRNVNSVFIGGGRTNIINRKTFSTSFSYSKTKEPIIHSSYFSVDYPSVNSSFYYSSNNFYKPNSTSDIFIRQNKQKTKIIKNSNTFGLYKYVFRDRNKIFPLKKKDIVDNKLNINYAENQEQYDKKILRMNRMKLARGEKINHDSISNLAKTKKKVEKMKESVSFYKSIMDYAYPDYVIEKNKVMSQGKKKKFLIHYEPAFKKIDDEKLADKQKRSQLLLKSLTIKKITKYM